MECDFILPDPDKSIAPHNGKKIKPIPNMIKLKSGINKIIIEDQLSQISRND